MRAHRHRFNRIPALLRTKTKNPLNGGLIKFVSLLLAAEPAQLR
ncbi:hypothetical protein ETAF_ple048 (plasmid) [Edwardsiella tarda FL6-60]|uniref:Uncharacterized protein n=1 Tax=Edwardsiella tarda (strain FL6-60) TaxID=718251 RepID=A0A0H3DVS6_EDWTF|nr:hypothetical protein ETAF_ple048 [Edwardsiella tarda FL6-60]